MEEVLIISGLIGVQIILSIYLVFLHQFLALGVNSFSLIILGGLASALFLLPFAVVLEKKKWPTKLRPMLMAQMLLIAILVLLLYGVKMTSPAIASAMPNLAPVIIFIIAACVGFEKFSIWCKYGRAKVLGTILCLGGAIAMSFLMTPPSSSPNSNASILMFSQKMSSSTIINNKKWILGCFYLLFAVIFLSSTTVLQAATMVSFPAPFSLTILTSLMGSIISALVQFIMEGTLINVGSASLDLKSFVGLVLLGAAVTGVCVGFQAWCVKKKGPVMVSIFNPVQTVSSAILSALVLGQVLNIGSLAGMFLMFVGLYVVLWAKMKEDCVAMNEDHVIKMSQDIEKPLLG